MLLQLLANSTNLFSQTFSSVFCENKTMLSLLKSLNLGSLSLISADEKIQSRWLCDNEIIELLFVLTICVNSTFVTLSSLNILHEAWLTAGNCAGSPT